MPQVDELIEKCHRAYYTRVNDWFWVWRNENHWHVGTTVRSAENYWQTFKVKPPHWNVQRDDLLTFRCIMEFLLSNPRGTDENNQDRVTLRSGDRRQGPDRSHRCEDGG